MKKVKFKIVSYIMVGVLFLGTILFLLLRTSGPSINATGSSSMLPLMQMYSDFYEEADINVSGGGSGHGVAQIADGNTDIGNMSSDKQDAIVSTPTGKLWEKNKIRTVTVAIDAIGIVIKLPNGIKYKAGINPVVKMETIAEIYDSKQSDKPTWNQLLINKNDLVTKNPKALNSTIQAYGRDGGKGASGTTDGFFHTLSKYNKKEKWGFKLDVNHVEPKIKKTQEANSAAFSVLNKASQGLAYLSLGYAEQAVNDPTSTVKIASIDEFKDKNQKVIVPNTKNAKNGLYKWVRPFNSAFSVNAKPFIINYIKWMLNVSMYDPQTATPKQKKKYATAYELFNQGAHLVSLTPAEAKAQLADINKTDYQLLQEKGTSEKSLDLKNQAFGLNLDYWGSKNA